MEQEHIDANCHLYGTGGRCFMPLRFVATVPQGEPDAPTQTHDGTRSTVHMVRMGPKDTFLVEHDDGSRVCVKKPTAPTAVIA